MGSYIGLAALVYVISVGVLVTYSVSEDKDISTQTVFCPVINTIAIFVMIIKFIIKAIRGLIEFITKS